MVLVSLHNPGMCENEMIVLFSVICPSDQLPPPTDLGFKWFRNFTVILSWKRPSGLSDNINYKYLLEEKTQNDTKIRCVSVMGVCGLFGGGSWVPWFQQYQWRMNSTSRFKCFLLPSSLHGITANQKNTLLMFIYFTISFSN